MKKKYSQIFQFKITLKDINPLILRVIQVPENYTFWDLHIAIQDAMGWKDYHLHRFNIPNPSNSKILEIRIPDDEFESDNKVYAGWANKISKWFTMDNRFAEYTYDFGDNWRHDMELKKIIPTEGGIIYPRCIYDERSFPPEDCGSTTGYKRLLEILKNKKYEEYKDMLRWVGGKYDPEHFDIKEVHFDHPKERLKKAFEEVE